ncbi:ATP dependent DNA ligase [Sinorhizobium meliloti]|uniref:ATP dependent DNA ligase n=1 Tax=Rhizobium meliloti TaxID=382 RepID=UPI000FDB5175|nr:hypothetical protein [Sinorhizobium meliloti]RVH34285.1 hypothetical protein CN211_16115 [Sinorhizobium meliloti]
MPQVGDRGAPSVDRAVHRRWCRRSWVGTGQRKGDAVVEPVLVAEVEYPAWTDDGKLRHASFKGIGPREDDATVLEVW